MILPFRDSQSRCVSRSWDKKKLKIFLNQLNDNNSKVMNFSSWERRSTTHARPRWCQVFKTKEGIHQKFDWASSSNEWTKTSVLPRLYTWSRYCKLLCDCFKYTSSKNQNFSNNNKLNVKNKFWTSYETLKSTGGMKWWNFNRFCTISLNFEIYFLEFPWEIVFSVISGNHPYLQLGNVKRTAKSLKLFCCQLFAHWKLKLLDFLSDFFSELLLFRSLNFPSAFSLSFLLIHSHLFFAEIYLPQNCRKKTCFLR